MNLCGRPPYQKGLKQPLSRGKARPPTKQEREYWERVRALGCIVGPLGCQGRITIHHCGTGAGGRKNHMKVIPLCEDMHHTGPDGVDGRHHGMSKKRWQEKYGSEDSLMQMVDRLLKLQEIL